MPTPFAAGNNGFEAAVYATVVEEQSSVSPVFQVISVSRSPEWALYGTEMDGKFRIVARRAVGPVWAIAHAGGGYNYRSDRWDVEVTEETFSVLRDVWVGFVRRTRVPNNAEGMSEPEYYFSARAGGSWVTGYAYGPKPGSCVADLALAAERLFEMVQSTKAGTIAVPPAELRALLERLASRH